MMMIGAVNKTTEEIFAFGEGFAALKKLMDFMKGKVVSDYRIYLGRFESERKEIMRDIEAAK